MKSSHGGKDGPSWPRSDTLVQKWLLPSKDSTALPEGLSLPSSFVSTIFRQGGFASTPVHGVSVNGNLMGAN